MIVVIKEEIIDGYKAITYSNGTVVRQIVGAAESEPELPGATDIELLMQAQADAELRDFAIQQGQEMLAQQMADIELTVLGGAV
mgnify:FL=1